MSYFILLAEYELPSLVLPSVVCTSALLREVVKTRITNLKVFMDKRHIYNTKIDIVYIIRTNNRVEI